MIQGQERTHILTLGSDAGLTAEGSKRDSEVLLGLLLTGIRISTRVHKEGSLAKTARGPRRAMVPGKRGLTSGSSRAWRGGRLEAELGRVLGIAPSRVSIRMRKEGLACVQKEGFACGGQGRGGNPGWPHICIVAIRMLKGKEEGENELGRKNK